MIFRKGCAANMRNVTLKVLTSSYLIPTWPRSRNNASVKIRREASLVYGAPKGRPSPSPGRSPGENIDQKQKALKGRFKIMSQSLARLPIHLIFSTKNRGPILTDKIRPSLHAYMATVLQNLDCPATLINSVEDHGHILFELSRTVSVSRAVEDVKKTSSKWIKSQGAEFARFAWQGGYGAFAVSESNVDSVRRYIAKSTRASS